MQTDTELTVNQEKLIACLLMEPTVQAACIATGINVTTYWRWMKSEHFVKEYRKARAQVMESVISKLQTLATKAVDTLERNLDCKAPNSEIRASQILLNEALKRHEMLELQERIVALENLLKERDLK
jgi:hypothetical protein